MCKECGYNKCPGGCPNAEPKVVATCAYCEVNLYPGDTCYQMDNDSFICTDCIDNCYTTLEEED